ncbi:hypothetical protein ABG067_007225 [Albugo candida]|uniref:Uncharacterized protein n=1 Tax=Albugo candida TaxID=65357 RepID=A0A024FUL3_9STRA|nr:unnamed protein product [Albugo candida]|eukprot:CCI10731.1 unnamed protein product [Albugo candida]
MVSEVHQRALGLQRRRRVVLELQQRQVMAILDRLYAMLNRLRQVEPIWRYISGFGSSVTFGSQSGRLVPQEQQKFAFGNTIGIEATQPTGLDLVLPTQHSENPHLLVFRYNTN